MRDGEALERLHALAEPRAYMQLELGGARPELIALARCATVVVAPAPRIAAGGQAGKPWLKLYAMAPAAFLAAADPAPTLEGQPLDLVVIAGAAEPDALAETLAALRRWAHPGTRVVILPETEDAAALAGATDVARTHWPHAGIERIAAEPVPFLLLTGAGAEETAAPVAPEPISLAHTLAAPETKPESAGRDAVVLAWFVPPQTPELGEYYLELLRRYHPAAKLFIGMNHGSDPRWEEAFRTSGMDAEVRWARPELGDYWDATGFITALEGFHDRDETFGLVWFGHTKGGSKAFAADTEVRAMLERDFWARREEIAAAFRDPALGLFAPRCNLTPPYPFPGPWNGWGEELAALQRVYRDEAQPLGLCALDTFFALRGAIVRRFCDAVGAPFFRTDPSAYGANKWFFEMAFPSIAAMQGYAPLIDRDVPGENAPRDDVMLSWDVRQVHRLAEEEVARWRANPLGFQPRILPWDRPAWQRTGDSAGLADAALATTPR
jgi:hypothetical protein